MKKQKNKRLLRLFGVCGLSLAFGLTACNTNSNNYQYNDSYVNVEKHSRKNIVYDESTYTITYEDDDLYDYSYWLNVYNVLNSEGYDTNNRLSITGSMVPRDGLNPVPIYEIYCSTYSYDSGSGIVSKNSIDFNCSDSSTSSNQLVFIDDSTMQYCTYMGGSSYTCDYLSITSETYYNLFIPVEPSNNFVGALGTFIQIIVSGIGQLATGVASGIGAMATSLFLNVEDGAVVGLSTFGGIMALFAGIALAITLTTRVYLWITSLGKD